MIDNIFRGGSWVRALIHAGAKKDQGLWERPPLSTSFIPIREELEIGPDSPLGEKALLGPYKSKKRGRGP